MADITYLDRFLCIVRNIRAHNSKAWNARTMNWVLVRDYFGLGSTRANEWCVWLGIDPDGYDAERAKEGEDE